MSTYNDGKNKCPVCGMEHIDIDSGNHNIKYYECPDCGKFFALDDGFGYNSVSKEYDAKKLRSYLFYHPTDKRTVLLDRERYNKFITDKFVDVYNLTPEMVENWYPKNFNEKINQILLSLADKSSYMGEEVTVNVNEIELLFFMQNRFSDNADCDKEFGFIRNYLLKNAFIYEALQPTFKGICSRGYMQLILTDIAWQKIYDLQKQQVNNKNVFVAMKFGKETEELRKKIKEGLEGYNVRIMDEIEHNHQIVPEMLYEIRNSKFVIAELTHHNNGAYYEAGYALGLGKEVIHICKKDELDNGLHFDVAQVNTIVYENIDELPEKIRKRIQATIV
ncbi:MAG: hypothetical protein J1F01_10490 [Oscillospiraceae bacterium]|nr:hypothetical protein [Oscillospiraceae bacterium]